MKLRTFILSTLLCAPSLVSAQAPSAAPRKAWEWTDEERIAARFAAGAPEERLDRLRTGRGANAPRISSSGARYIDVVEGETDAALFLPIEIYQAFLEVVLYPGQKEPSSVEKERIAHLLAVASSYGLPEALPEIMRAESVPLLALREAHAADISAWLSSHSNSVAKADENALAKLKRDFARSHCQLVFQSFHGVMARLGSDGAQRFLRYMYEVLAPEMVTVGERDDESFEQSMRRLAAGCR